MNVLFITNNFPPVVDGVGDYSYNLATLFLSKGHNVSVVCHKNKLVRSIDNIRVYSDVNCWNKTSLSCILNVIYRDNIDIVLLQYVPHAFQNKGLPFGLIGILNGIKKKSNVKIFTFCHEVAVIARNFNPKRMLLSFVMKYITKQIVRRSDWVSTSIDYYRQMLQSMDKSKNIGMIPIASNIPDNRLSECELRLLRSKIAPDNELIISFFGVRNIETSLKALEILISEGYRIKPLIIGKTSKKLCIPSSLKVYRTGILELNEIDKYFQVTDIMILPESNTFGASFKSGSLSASLNKGLSVVTAKGPATSEQMVHMENVIFVDFTEISVIVEQLKILIASEKLRTSLGIKARLMSLDLNWKTTYENYMRIIQNDRSGK